MKYLLLFVALTLPACQCGLKIDSKSSGVDTAAQAADEERKIQAIITKFSHDEINEMWIDLYKSKDNRPESIINEKLLYEAHKRTKPKPDMAKVDVANEKLRGL